MHYAGNDWSRAQIDGLKTQFEAMGIEVLGVTDAGFKPEKQVADIETMLAKKPDIIVSIPTDPIATAVAYKKAAAQGVKLVFMDNVPKGLEAGKDYVSVVSADNYGYAIYGRELANNMLSVDGSWEKLRVRGFVTRPTATRGNRAWQSYFVNNRYIKSRLLSAAVEEAYRNQIMVGRFPACVLEIDMPVQAVDVNVHPAKTEVKFLSEREVFDAVHYAVLSTLNKAAGRPEWKLSEKQTSAAQPQVQPHAVQPPKPGFFRRIMRMFSPR